MEDPDRHRQMSLIPYQPAESRQIVLRHGSAVVVYDQHSKQLSLRDDPTSSVDDAACPYCHRPYRRGSHDDESHEADEHTAFPDAEPGFVNPGYFQMLRRSQPGSAEVSRPPSPHKQLAPPPMQGSNGVLRGPPRSDFVSSEPAPTRNHGISAHAFSPNYFKTFFVEERELGRGGKGVVLLVRHVLDGVSLGQFACKRVPVGDDHEWLEKVLIEVQLLQNLSHQNLVSYRHVWLEDYQISTFGPSVPCAFIMQQYCNGGDLQSYVLAGLKTTLTTEQMKERLRRRSKGQLDESNDVNGARKMHFEEIISFFKDITSGLNHLHANGYIHRDLKPSNCLLHNTGRKVRVLVSDFGEVQVANVARKSTGATGTISYCAPEVLSHVTPGGPLGNFTTKSDIFSLGMIVYFMCFSRLPYQEADGIDEDGEDLEKLRAEISMWAGFDDGNRVRRDLPEKLYRSLKHLLALNPDERPATEEILHALKSSLVLDEMSSFSAPSGLDEVGSRISRADTPSPGPGKTLLHSSRTTVYTRPGRSKLHTGTSASAHTTPSPPPTTAATSQPMAKQTSEGSMILRPRKIVDQHAELPPALHPSTPGQRSPRLMLPPSTPAYSHHAYLRHVLHTPALVNMIKLALFIIKVFTVFGPCQPFAADPRVAYPLLAIATADFLGSTGLAHDWKGAQQRMDSNADKKVVWSVVLFVVHLVLLGGFRKWDKLCLGVG